MLVTKAEGSKASPPVLSKRLRWSTGWLFVVMLAVVVWLFEWWALRAATEKLKLEIQWWRVGAVTAASGCALLVAGSLGLLAAIGAEWALRRLQLAAFRWLRLWLAIVMLAGFGFAAFWGADDFLVAPGTRALFVAWSAFLAGVVALPTSSWLARRCSSRLPHRFGPRGILTGWMVAVVGAASLLSFEGEVFRALDGWSMAPIPLAPLLAVTAACWSPAIPRSVVWASIGTLSLSLAAFAGALFDGQGLTVVVEQHTTLTRAVSAFRLWGDGGQPVAPRHQAGSCKPGVTAIAPTETPPVDKNAPNIILATVDGIRWDHTSLGGYRRNTTPNLKKLTEHQGAVFTRAYSNSASTRQTFRSLLSGLMPSQVPASRGKNKWALSFPNGQWTLGHYLSSAGMLTVAIQTSRVFLEKESRGLDGFEVRDFSPSQAWKTKNYSADAHVDRIIAHISDATERRPRFVISHMMEPHLPFRAAPFAKKYGTSKSLRNRYDRALRYVDGELARLIRYATSPEHRAGTYLIITSDHGMGIGDRNGMKQHGNSLLDDQVHVPLLIFGPGVKAQEYAHPVSLVDLFPTIMAMAGLEAPEHTCGSSLLPLLKGHVNIHEEPVLVQIFPDHANPRYKLGYVSERHKLMLDVRKKHVSLYDLKKDPGERKDIAPKMPDLVRKLKVKLRPILRSRNLDPEVYEFSSNP